MDKKSIVLLVVSSIILILAIIFAVWSFSIDLNGTKEANFKNENSDVSENILEDSLYSNSSENKSETNNILEESETKDFDAVYTDFEVEDENGNKIRLSQYKDKPVIVVFLNNKNEDSVEMLKRIEKEYENYKENINFILIQANEAKNDNIKNVNLPIYYDKQSEVTKMYNITEFPTILYINKNNEIFNAKVGLTSEDALTANLDILIENF